METKVCPKCELEKNINRFCKDKKSKDGLQSYCKDCKNEGNKVYYKNNPKKRGGKTKEQRLKIYYNNRVQKYKHIILYIHIED